MMILPIIMAGGSGSRLWPMSRDVFPKQFLRLYGAESMLQGTVARLLGLDTEMPLIVCNEFHHDLVQEQLKEIGYDYSRLILEPVGKNTAPAIAMAALTAMESGQDPVLLVLAADHIIKDIATFQESVKAAAYYADKNHIVTFGVTPDSPETGYGYIRRGVPLNDQESELAYKVACFVEKPDKKLAQKYLNSKQYYWNSGMFMFRASIYLEELRQFRPDILSACERSHKKTKTIGKSLFLDEKTFKKVPEESIDYAVIEKTARAVVVPMDAEWSDVGSWFALWKISQKDNNDNTIIGDVFLENSNNCYVNTDEKLVAAVGVDNLVIVNTKDAVLVIDKSRVQEVRKIVDYLKQQGG